VAELKAMGVPDPAGSDLNRDGYLDTKDLALFLRSPK
jgi:hypothetical protein